MLEPSLNLDECRARQRRLLDVMRQMEVEAVVLANPANVQWLTGIRHHWLFEPAAVLTDSGHCTLIAADKPPVSSAADTVVTYKSKHHSTLRNDQRQASSEQVLAVLAQKKSPQRVGVEFSSVGMHWFATLKCDLRDIEPNLYELRRIKHADELALIKKAILATEKMYAFARGMIRPGVNELDLYARLHATCVTALGEPPTALGNDFQCGSRGGPPRDRNAQAGELYILDLGPAYRGYFADNSRTICVDGQPTKAQQHAWNCICETFSMIEKMVKPGVRCQDVFHMVQEHLDRTHPGVFNHHLGHGIGLYPHEAPHLNPNWDDKFQVGEVFTCEPGLYGDELRQGIRQENDYLVTADGVELLTQFSLAL